jgi:hypothetical protein
MHFSPEPQLRNTLCRRHGAFGKLLFWTDQKETFASRENTLLGQWEVGVGGGSRGGPMARLSRLVGRGRALEILLRKTPDLSGELFRRMNAVYAQVLPGLGARVESVIGGVYMVIGPEKQLAAYEQYLKKADAPNTRVWRLYPRDFWLPAE